MSTSEPTPPPENPNAGAAPEVLASDAEREHVAVVLRDATVDGRLTLEEFDERVGAAHQARTHGELATLTGDLPSTRAIAPAEPETKMRAVGSRLVRKGRWSLSRRMSFRSVFGTIHLDLRDATLPGAEVDLHVRNFFGTVTVIVPAGVDTQVLGGGLFASQVLEPGRTAPAPGAPVLRIHDSGSGGTLYVRSEPRKGGLEVLQTLLGR
jgi:hypothetical protein